MATGPSTEQTPYLVPIEEGVAFTSILSAGDRINEDYQMVGVPDGLGAYDNGDGTMTVLMNHELQPTQGIVRDHGSTGAFVSELIIDKETLEVVGADDLAKTVFTYDPVTDSYVEGTTAFNRLCSSDLPEPSAFFDAESGLGTTERIYMTGEESSPPFGPYGRAFAFVATDNDTTDGTDAGAAYELPRLGDFSWENSVASPYSGKKTVVIGTDDATPGQVYVYIGEKQADGLAIDRAGLTNGSLFGVKAAFANDSAATPTKTTFTLEDLGDQSDDNGVGLQAGSEAQGVTEFGRPEDGAWDPSNPNRFYFVTTGNSETARAVPGEPNPVPAAPTRLWAMDFYDVQRPELGGELTILVDADEGVVSLDNMTVTESGLVIMQEDPGSSTRSAKIWMYDPEADTRSPESTTGNTGLTLLAQHDPERFGDDDPSTAQTGATPPFTTNEESSGVIDATALLGDGQRLSFLLDVQAHYTFPDAEVVEGGQLLQMDVELDNPGDDNFRGGRRDDAFDAGFGDDGLRGGDGEDDLRGNYGDDEIYGDDGRDDLAGGVGDDVIDGGRQRDFIDGGTGNDRLDGGLHDDVVDGGVGDDILFGGSGAGSDTLRGGFGNDRLLGGDDADRLEGGAGSDRLAGQRGSDALFGGNGADTLTGGKGSDSFHFLFPDEGPDVIADFVSGTDRIVFSRTGFGLEPGEQVDFTGNFVGDDNFDGEGPVLIYRKADGKLYFDPDGSGEDRTLIATLQNPTSLDQNDIVFA